jgi:hypothetical protein
MLTLPNNVTDAGLARLAGMRGLRTVHIHREQSCPSLTDESVQRLRSRRPDLAIDPP